MVLNDSIDGVVSELMHASKIIALTGAGISVESGIAPFRGKGGLWEKYDPEDYAHVTSFQKNPERSWVMLKDMGVQIFSAEPNPAHYSLTRLQKLGKLDTIITQNVDNLHQEAGNNNVIEFHGNYKKLVCLECGRSIPFEKHIIHDIPPVPRCECDAVLKPNVVLFGESPPFEAMAQSNSKASLCDVMLIIGTSAVIYPAANLPFIAKKHHAKIIEINTEPSDLTKYLSDYFIQGKAGTILPRIVKKVEEEL